MNTKCQVFTPPDYVEKMLDMVGYKSGLYGKKVLENSCGDGNILIGVIKRYIEDCKIQGLSEDRIRKGLERDIVGYEIDFKCVEVCKKKLNKVLIENEIKPIKWNIYNLDYLKTKKAYLYDYIIGNPPYVTYSEIEKIDQDYLRENFQSCQYGKFDYCYAFIEKSITELLNNGKMVYLIPSSIFKTVFGKKIREIMKKHLSEIIEYTKRDVFDDVLVKSAIICYDKEKIDNYIRYINDDIKRIISVDSLQEKWFFSDINKEGIKFGEYFKVSHAVATLLNRAFIIKDRCYMEDEKKLVIGDYFIEKDLVRETETPRTKRMNIRERIIFPYYYDNKELCRYSEKEFREIYPGASRYLYQFYDDLIKRKIDKNAKWFEYGRSQALKRLNTKKLLISTVISHEVKPHFLSENCIPYAGLFIVPKDGKDSCSLKEAYDILVSDSFFEYTQNVGIHINGNSVRITSKDIENYVVKEWS